MDIPDVSGYSLKKALKLLELQGFNNIKILQTAAPRLRDAGYDENARVVRRALGEGGEIELLVCSIHIQN